MPARVMIVEDDAALRKVYIAVLTKEGYQVEFASDGQDALRKATQNPPDLVLLDVMMSLIRFGGQVNYVNSVPRASSSMSITGARRRPCEIRRWPVAAVERPTAI